MARASCLCGGVAWEAPGPFDWMSHCHCSMCRKKHGAPFATYVRAAAAGFGWLRGREQIVQYESSPGFFRPFCARCGSVVAGEPEQGHVFMPAGCLDDDPGARPQAHIFVASKAPWYELPADGLPRFDAYPPGVQPPAVASPEPAASGGGCVRGSCLCRAVAFELAGSPRRMYSCHCSRCRKARSAAHATNLFGEAARFRWLRGEEQLQTFKLPEAKRFTTVFCRVCGSNLPRLRPETNAALIPAGSIDGDPGTRPQAHIYCASRAPWFEIPDDGLPRFDAVPPEPR